MKRSILIFYLLILSVAGSAQDHIYSQFYNAPNYLNPALNGQFDGDLRVNMIYRNQWSQIPGPLTYYTFSIDYSIPRFDGGVGLMITKSSEGTAYLNKINIAGIYSYSVSFDNSILSFGLQAGMTNRKLDYSKLIFLDQLDAQGIIPGGISGTTMPEFNSRFFFDAGAGINLVAGNLMIGASGQHLNRPDESFTGTRSPLPMRLNGYASYKLPLDLYNEESNQSVIPSILYYNQAKASSLSLGCQYKNRNVNLGLWYRGGGKQQDAVVLSVILDLFVKRDYNDKIRLGISHDATTSKLPYGRTAGTTEGALNYETIMNQNNYGNRGQYRGNYGNRCYDFY